MSDNRHEHDDNRTTGPADEDALDEQAFEVADGPQGADASAAAPGDVDGDASPEDELAALRAERDEIEQRMLRYAADYQNYIRRSEQNVKDARRLQTMEMSRALLTVLDHFDRALEVDPESTSANAMRDGVEMVHGEFLRTLERFGVTRIDAAPGDAFDPNRHEAMMHQPSPEIESGCVVTQLQPGYAIGDTTLRPAKVSIAQ